MGMVIAVNGKGGTGKTTVAALLIGYLAALKSARILAIDADPNHTLAAALGAAAGQTMVGVIEEATARKDALPAGMTKDRFIEMRVQESIAEEDGYDLLAMGRPEGPGCYCYVNSVLRNVIGAVTRAYDTVVIDNAAGMEHISRRTERAIDRLILVSDFSVVGVRSCRRIDDLAKELGIAVGKSFLVVNKVTGPLDPLRGEIDRCGVPLAGTLPYDAELEQLSVAGRPVTGLADTAIARAVPGLYETIMTR